jgi:hypothetical protein
MLLRTRSLGFQLALALSAAVLWGVVEWVALWRSRRRERNATALRP